MRKQSPTAPLALPSFAEFFSVGGVWLSHESNTSITTSHKCQGACSVRAFDSVQDQSPELKGYGEPPPTRVRWNLLSVFVLLLDVPGR